MSFLKSAYKAVVGSVLVYLAVMVYFYTMQETIMFHPKPATYNHISEIADVNPSLRGMDEIWLNSQDGVKLHGWYKKPKDGFEMVVLFHGNSGNLEQRIEILSVLANMGYGFFIPAWRGFSKSEGKPSKPGLLTDAETAIKYVKSQGFTPDQIVIVGESLGTGMAVHIASKEIYRGVVLLTPYTSIGDRAKEMYPFLFIDGLLRNDFQNLPYIDKLQQPLLLVHGTNDFVIPHSHSEKLFDAALEPKKIILFEGAGHSNYDTVSAFKEMQDFLALTK